MTVESKKKQVVNHNYSKRAYQVGGYKSFEDFYPYYLSEHCNKTNRRLHLFSTTNAALIILYLLVTRKFRKYWWIALVQGYAFAWIGHFFFERNKPATFKHPIYSFRGDWKMWFEGELKHDSFGNSTA
ncbi:hypothetical protein DFQ26_005011 [Actinomortierella ambigua]|nr:hypothetical protein DFQ26_005011 [Actinomortierella ambigua]